MAGPEESDADATADIVVIAPAGHLLLEAIDEKRNHTFTYRIDIDQVRNASAYFEKLLDPKKFGEGATVAKQLVALKEKHGTISNVPVDDLPRVKVSDVGRTSKVSSIKLLIRDFLCVLHGQGIAAGSTSPGTSVVPLANIANLAVVADRFDALPYTTAYIRRKHMLETIDARSKVKATKVPEERWRQRLLVGLLFDHASWVMSASQALIIIGSVRWKQDATTNDDLPLWWDLPQGLEGNFYPRERLHLIQAIGSPRFAQHFCHAFISVA
jgi:hypothetical protein